MYHRKKNQCTLLLFRYTHGSSTMNHAPWQLLGHLSQREEEIPLPYIPVYHADVRHWWLIWGTGVFLAALNQQMECARLRTSQCCTVMLLCINTAFCCPLLWMHSFPLWKPEFISFHSKKWLQMVDHLVFILIWSQDCKNQCIIFSLKFSPVCNMMRTLWALSSNANMALQNIVTFINPSKLGLYISTISISYCKHWIYFCMCIQYS